MFKLYIYIYLYLFIPNLACHVCSAAVSLVSTIQGSNCVIATTSYKNLAFILEVSKNELVKKPGYMSFCELKCLMTKLQFNAIYQYYLWVKYYY